MATQPTGFPSGARGSPRRGEHHGHGLLRQGGIWGGAAGPPLIGTPCCVLRQCRCQVRMLISPRWDLARAGEEVGQGLAELEAEVLVEQQLHAAVCRRRSRGLDLLKPGFGRWLAARGTISLQGGCSGYGC